MILPVGTVNEELSSCCLTRSCILWVHPESVLVTPDDQLQVPYSIERDGKTIMKGEYAWYIPIITSRLKENRKYLRRDNPEVSGKRQNFLYLIKHAPWRRVWKGNSSWYPSVRRLYPQATCTQWRRGNVLGIEPRSSNPHYVIILTSAKRRPLVPTVHKCSLLPYGTLLGRNVFEIPSNVGSPQSHECQAFLQHGGSCNLHVTEGGILNGEGIAWPME